MDRLKTVMPWVNGWASQVCALWALFEGLWLLAIVLTVCAGLWLSMARHPD